MVAPDGLIIHLGGPFVGRRHDAAVYMMSGLEEKMERHAVIPPGPLNLLPVADSDGRQLPMPLALYGDAAYSASPHMLKAIPNPLTEQEIMYNEIMNSNRTMVEHRFGDVIRYWAFLDFQKNQKVF